MSQPAELADRFLFCQFCLWSIIFSKLHLTVERGNCLSVPHISQEPFVQPASLLAGLLQSTLGSAVLDVVAICAICSMLIHLKLTLLCAAARAQFQHTGLMDLKTQHVIPLTSSRGEEDINKW